MTFYCVTSSMDSHSYFLHLHDLTTPTPSQPQSTPPLLQSLLNNKHKEKHNVIVKLPNPRPRLGPRHPRRLHRTPTPAASPLPSKRANTTPPATTLPFPLPKFHLTHRNPHQHSHAQKTPTQAPPPLPPLPSPLRNPPLLPPQSPPGPLPSAMS